MIVAKRISTKTTSHPLMQRTPHDLRSRSCKLADTYRADELSYVRAPLKHQLTNRYRYRTDISRSRNRIFRDASTSWSYRV